MSVGEREVVSIGSCIVDQEILIYLTLVCCSFAIVIWGILTQKKPYQGKSTIYKEERLIKGDLSFIIAILSPYFSNLLFVIIIIAIIETIPAQSHITSFLRMH